jgi:hypothetical protein
MIPYPSIESVWKREGKYLVPGAIREPVVECVREWFLTEKVDGTNIRLIFSEEGLDVRGRTDRAQFKPSQLDFLRGLVDVDHAKEMLRHPTRPDWVVTVYGELFGPGIQRGGHYASGLRFRAFDVMFGDTTWGDRDDLVTICERLGLEYVPVVATMTDLDQLPRTTADMTTLVGTSAVAETAGLQMEGIVARPALTLLDKRGNRVMFKLCYRDLKDE